MLRGLSSAFQLSDFSSRDVGALGYGVRGQRSQSEDLQGGVREERVEQELLNVEQNVCLLAIVVYRWETVMMMNVRRDDDE